MHDTYLLTSTHEYIKLCIPISRCNQTRQALLSLDNSTNYHYNRTAGAQHPDGITSSTRADAASLFFFRARKSPHIQGNVQRIPLRMGVFFFQAELCNSIPCVKNLFIYHICSARVVSLFFQKPFECVSYNIHYGGARVALISHSSYKGLNSSCSVHCTLSIQCTEV